MIAYLFCISHLISALVWVNKLQRQHELNVFPNTVILITIRVHASPSLFVFFSLTIVVTKDDGFLLYSL